MPKFPTPSFRIFALSACAVTLFATSPAFAADTTASLSTTATVTSNCAVTTTAVAFGNVDVTSNADVDGTGGISVTCTNGTAWTAKADLGSGTGASITTRKMTSGANLLDYTLYTDTGRLTIWGDGTTGNGSPITGTGTGNAQATTIYARIPSAQTTKPAGSYADTVTVTVSYT